MSLTKQLKSVNKLLENKQEKLKELSKEEKLNAEILALKGLLKNISKSTSDFGSLDKVVKAIESKKYPEPVKSVKIEDEIKLKKPKWFKQINTNDILLSLSDLLSSLLSRTFKVNLDEYKSAKNAVAVRISNGKEFVHSLGGAIASATSDFTLPDWLKTNQEQILNELNEFNLNDNRSHSSNANIEYLGKEKADATWLVVEIDQTTDTSFRYATVKNNTSYTNYLEAFNNRETLVYGTYSEAF